MKNYKSFGVTQKIMAELAGTHPSTMNKIITSGNYSPIDANSHRNMRFSVHDTRTLIKKALKTVSQTQTSMCFYNFKGGVGKTSLCFQVSSHLALMGYNVLAVDADPQGHLSTSFGFDTEDNFLTLYDVIANNVPITEVITNIYEGLDCLPSNISLTRLEPALNELPKREERVSMALSPVKEKYDFIVFDTNPTISHLNRNIIAFTDLINVVVETQAYSLNGLKLLMADLDKFFASMMMKKPKIIIIPNRYEERTTASGEAMAVLKEYYGEYVIQDFAIRKSEDFNASAKNSEPLAFFCRVNSIAFEDINEVLKYILKIANGSHSLVDDQN
jgi:chromosome partitioning protein